jgi:hypothetical protein
MNNSITVDQTDYFNTYSLSTDGYTFKYRPDKYDSDCIRADLYKGENLVSSVRVSAGYGLPHRPHHNVINFFESEITLGRIK